jgi:hypothetical protein
MTVTRQEYNRLQVEAIRQLKQLEQRHGTRENALAVSGSKNLAEFIKWRAYALFCTAHGLNLNDGTPTPEFI